MSFNLPTPTRWIEIEKGADGFIVEPPSGLILVLLTSTLDEEDGSVVIAPVIGEYSAKVRAFLDADGVAIEHFTTVTHYHVLHEPNLQPLQLDS